MQVGSEVGECECRLPGEPLLAALGPESTGGGDDHPRSSCIVARRGDRRFPAVELAQKMMPVGVRPGRGLDASARYRSPAVGAFGLTLGRRSGSHAANRVASRLRMNRLRPEDEYGHPGRFAGAVLIEGFS